MTDIVTDTPVSEDTQRHPSPWLWLLLVAALLAVAWYFLAGRDTTDDAMAPVPVESTELPATEIGPPVAVESAPEPSPTPVATGETRAAEPIARLQPDYPRDAFRAGEEGRVLLRVQVDAGGNPVDVQVADSSGSRELDRAAVEAMRQWRFEPALDDGDAVASTVEIPIDFTLE